MIDDDDGDDEFDDDDGNLDVEGNSRERQVRILNNIFFFRSIRMR